MNLLDWLLVVLVLAYALSGYWQGFVIGAFATGGLLLGGLFGVWIAPVALGDADPSLLVSLGALFIVILAASLGPGAAAVHRRQDPRPDHLAAGRARSTRSEARCSARSPCSSSPGRSASRSPGRGSAASRPGARSEVLAGVDEVLPDAAGGVARALQQRGRHQLLPALPRAVRARADRRGRARAEAAAHRPRRRGRRRRAWSRSAAPTSAGAASRDRLRVRRRPGDDQRPRRRRRRRPRGRDRRGARSSAEVVYYNPDLDVAVLAVDTAGLPDAAARPTSAGAEDGGRDPGLPAGRAVRRPAAAGSAPSSGCARPTSTARGPSSARCTRCAALVRPGNSGGPIVSSAGDVVGVVFAASVTDEDTGYALTAEPGGAERGRGADRRRAGRTGDCAAD